jgi:hypothetical protein
MNWHRWLATLFVMLALAACVQGGQVRYAPYTPHDREVTGAGAALACSGQGQSDLAYRWHRSREQSRPPDSRQALRHSRPGQPPFWLLRRA